MRAIEAVNALVNARSETPETETISWTDFYGILTLMEKVQSGRQYLTRLRSVLNELELSDAGLQDMDAALEELYRKAANSVQAYFDQEHVRRRLERL